MTRKSEPFCSSEELFYDYINLNLSYKNISKKYNVGHKRVETWIKNFGIKPRHQSDFKDLSGKIFGKWSVIKLDEKKSTKKTKYWICRCQCENIKSVNGATLRDGSSTQCKQCYLKILHEQNKGKRIGTNNPFYNKKHTEETKQRMKENHADFSGVNNPFLKAINRDPSIREKISTIRKEWYKNASEEVMKLRAERLSYSISNSEFHKNNSSFKNHEHGHFVTRFGNKAFYRSSWEKQVLEILNNLDFVVALKAELFVIKYELLGANRFTRPDIYIEFDNGKIALLEIKPFALIMYRNNFQKIHAQINYCKQNGFNFRLVTDRFIKDKELFLKLIQQIYEKGK